MQFQCCFDVVDQNILIDWKKGPDKTGLEQIYHFTHVFSTYTVVGFSMEFHKVLYMLALESIIQQNGINLNCDADDT